MGPKGVPDTKTDRPTDRRSKHQLKKKTVTKKTRTCWQVEFKQCSSRGRTARSVSRNVTNDRSRSAKTLVGTSQINSLASSGFTEQHSRSSEPQRKATFPAVFQAATPSVDFNYSRLAIAINSRPVTSGAPPQTLHNASGVFTERANKSAYYLQPSINCDYPPQ
jgi:hypothetical protein